jgi:hypothetical protein
MFDKYEGTPERDVLMMMLDVLKMESSIERIGDDILVCDSLDGDEMHDGFKFAREEEYGNAEAKDRTIKEFMNEELDVSKEMELLKKAIKKRK